METFSYRNNKGELVFGGPVIARKLENESKWYEALEAWKECAKREAYYKGEVSTVEFLIQAFEAGDALRRRLANDPEHQLLCVRVKIEKGEELTDEEKELVKSKLRQ